MWLRGEAELYSILTALGPEGLKIALINSAIVMLQQGDLSAGVPFNNNLLFH